MMINIKTLEVVRHSVTYIEKRTCPDQEEQPYPTTLAIRNNENQRKLCTN